MKAYLKLLLRHRWVLAFAPVIGGFLALGYISSYYNNLYAGDYETIRAYIVPNFHLIVSLLSVWWTVIFFSQFTTEQGNELIYMSFRTSSVIKCQLLMEALYAILVFLYFLAVRIVLLFGGGEFFYGRAGIFSDTVDKKYQPVAGGRRCLLRVSPEV